jgi:BirA family transcriptional regulator, biotin operon repressor / biotin---[acetyl-CoA-carboxylase] ligase
MHRVSTRTMICFTRHHHLTLTSTQDVCRALAEHGAPEGTVVTADEQTAGRGRAGHQWFSPRGQAVYASILLRPALGLRQSSWLTMLAALAILEGWKVGRLEGWKMTNLQTFQPPNPSTPRIKWLNDINLNGKKVCGILVETSITADQLDYAIVGIGLNVNTDFADAPQDVRARATSLKQEFGAELDRDAILQTLLQNLGARYAQLQHSPATEYAQHVETLGQPVRVQVGDEVIAGVATGVDEWGALQIQTSVEVRSISFGHLLS